MFQFLTLFLCARHAITLGAPTDLLSSLVPVIVKSLGNTYPELVVHQDLIVSTITEEEKSFSSLLPRGVKYIDELLDSVAMQKSESKVIGGEHVFFLYDTLGFPTDLTQLILSDRGYVVDMEGFDKEMAIQRSNSRLASRGGVNSGGFVAPLTLQVEQLAHLTARQVTHTDDSWKYDTPSRASSSYPVHIVAMMRDGELVDVLDSTLDHGVVIGIILDRTPFYAEAGGQISDVGSLESVDDKTGMGTSLQVLLVQSFGPYCLHTCRVADWSRSLSVGDAMTAMPDIARKKRITPNHTMTHMLNFALRKVLSGSLVDQKGSQVADNKLRFDFSHGKSLSSAQLLEVERIVNTAIHECLPVHTASLPLESALRISSVRAVFGERYPDPVRVVSVGAALEDVMSSPTSDKWLNYSIEFCGGTHIECTSQAVRFVITEEVSIAQGIRRISALTGDAAEVANNDGNRLADEARKLKECVATMLNNDVEANPEAEKEFLLANQSAVASLLKEVDAATISTVLKTDLRGHLGTLQKMLHSKLKAVNLNIADREIMHLVKAAVMAVEQGRKCAVLCVQGEQFADAAVLKKLLADVRAAAPTLSFALVINDRTKLTCVTVVPTSETAVRGLDASEWVSRIVSPLGGKGGGRADVAQGTVKNVEAYEDMQQAAYKYYEEL